MILKLKHLLLDMGGEGESEAESEEPDLMSCSLGSGFVVAGFGSSLKGFRSSASFGSGFTETCTKREAGVSLTPE